MSEYRIVSRFYPTQYWTEHGPEIIATAKELNRNKWSFRESRQLAANGLRTRSFEATGGELRHVWVQGLAIWLLVILLNMSRGWVGQFLSFNGAKEPTWSSAVVLVALIAMAFSTRWPAILLVASALLTSSFAEDGSPVWLGLVLAAVATMPVAVFGDGRRIASPTVLGLLFVAVTAATSFWFISPLLIGPALLVLGLAIVRLDARLLAAATIHAATIALVVTVEVFSVPTDPVKSVNESSAGLIVGAVALAASAAVLGAIVIWRTRVTSRHF